MRAREAGYDAVQIHGAHGYLVSQFLSPLRNRRTDEWGGDIAGRSRFLKEIGRAARAAVGPDYPLFVKLGVRDYKEGGLTLADGLWVVGKLKGWGFDAVEISHGVGGPEATARSNGSAETEAPFLAFSRAAREVTDLPLILVYGLRTAAAMREVVSAGAADFVSLCRPLIREPGCLGGFGSARPRSRSAGPAVAAGRAGSARGRRAGTRHCWRGTGPASPAEWIHCSRREPL